MAKKLKYQIEGSRIRKLAVKARETPLPFAFKPAKAIEDSYFAMHVSKDVDTLKTEAKSAGEGSKYTFGTCSVEGKVMLLTCQKNLPNAAKNLKKYFKTQKVALNVRIMDESGNVLEEDIEELAEDDDQDLVDDLEDDEDEDSPEDEDASGDVGETASQASGEVEELLARLDRCETRISNTTGPVAEQLDAMAAKVRDQLNAGDLGKATTNLVGIEAALKKLADDAGTAQPQDTAAETVVDKKPFLERVQSAKDRLAPLPEQLKAPIADSLRGIIANIAAEDFDAAGVGLGQVEKALEAAMARLAENKARWDAMHQDLDPRVSAYAETGTPRAAQTLAIWKKANEAAGKSDYATAIKSGAAIEKVLSAPDTTQSATPSVSGKDIAKEVRDLWEGAYQTASKQIEDLRREFAKESGDNSQALSGGLLVQFTAGYFVKLNATFVELEKAEANSVRSACDQAKKVYDEFGNFLRTDKAIHMMDNNPLGVTMDLSEGLGSVLIDMDKVLNDAVSSLGKAA